MTDELNIDNTASAVNDEASWGGLEALPGHPIMWVLILSELVVFGAFLLVFSVARISETANFASDQQQLDQIAGGVNTIILLTSGLFAVFAARAVHAGNVVRCRMWLLTTSAFGAVFLVIKLVEYSAKVDVGIGLESSTFFTLYFLITGFHALHVVMGLGVLGVVAVWPSEVNVETGTAFWHMIDMVWVLIFPVIYLVH